MPKALCVAALALGVSACNHSKGVRLADGGASDGPPANGDRDGASLDSANLLDSGGTPDLNPSPGVESVRFTVSYGECGGFCNHSLLVSASGATLRSSTNPPSSIHTGDESIVLDADVTGEILDAAAHTLGSPWENRYGCPDCADQGAYHLEVTASGTIRKTVLDPQQHPTLFDPLIAALVPVMKAHPSPKSICVLAPANCTPGQVSLVLGLDADGGLQPTWYNDLEYSVFLPGCTTVTFEREEGGKVTWSGHAAECVWEGNARALGFTDMFTDFALTTKDRPGTYRATGTYHEGCTPGKPISQAACTNQATVTSNSITVTH